MTRSHVRTWKKELALVWIVLVALTLIGPALTGGSARTLLLAVAAVKFAAITTSFMELRFAHRIWAVAAPAVGLLVLLFVALQA